jgi:hypothetical protein
MGGVDRSDRLVRTYSVSRKSKKWWYRLFYYLLDTALANSYILYNNSPNHDDLSELDYLKQLSVALIGTISKDEKVRTKEEGENFDSPTTYSWESLANECKKTTKLLALRTSWKKGYSISLCLQSLLSALSFIILEANKSC